MIHNSNVQTRNLEKSLGVLGIQKDEIEQIIKNKTIPEELNFSEGPKPYWGGYYGTISAYNF